MTLDCCACGACCASPLDDGGDVETFVAVNRLDVPRLGGRARRLVVVDAGTPSGLALAVRRTASGRTVCAALRGDPGPGAQVRCDAYEVRPDACREVEPGDAWCLESRARLGVS